MRLLIAVVVFVISSASMAYLGEEGELVKAEGGRAIGVINNEDCTNAIKINNSKISKKRILGSAGEDNGGKIINIEGTKPSGDTN